MVKKATRQPSKPRRPRTGSARANKTAKRALFKFSAAREAASIDALFDDFAHNLARRLASAPAHNDAAPKTSPATPCNQKQGDGI